MEDNTSKSSTPTFTIPSDLLVSLGTVPVLLALVGSRAIAQSLQTLGQLSEEIFRGDRLPVLPNPDSDDSVENSNS